MFTLDAWWCILKEKWIFKNLLQEKSVSHVFCKLRPPPLSQEAQVLSENGISDADTMSNNYQIERLST